MGNGARVTIASVADAAGVSVPTVSKVVNGRADVAPDTRERVERVLRESGYKRRSPSRYARAALLDVVFNELESPWAMEIVKGVGRSRARTSWASCSRPRRARARSAVPGSTRWRRGAAPA
jgi:DNA-binding LacI/PurR family transcriptional regulator